MTRQEKKVVRFKLQMDEKKMDNRKCLSEHLRRMFKTEGEMALYCLSYNLRRAMNLRTMDELMAGMAK